MKTSNLVVAVFGAVLRVFFLVAAVLIIYRGAVFCYDYGYRTFAEPAVSSGEGRMVTVSVTKEMTAAEIGELFASKGLIRDARLFVLQYNFSEFRKDVKPGVYELSTAMTVEEMMEVMATPAPEEDAA